VKKQYLIVHENAMCNETMRKAACLQQAKEKSRTDGQPSGLRVGTIPWPARPFYFALTWAAGAVAYLYYAPCRLTSRISIEGSGNHDLSQPSIFCIWLENWLSYFVVFLRYRSAHALITHPACKKLPLPFSRIKVIVHEPTHVNGQNFPETISHIVGALGA
jgi:hypothetical protein